MFEKEAKRAGRTAPIFPQNLIAKFGSKGAGQTSCETKIVAILTWVNGKNERSVLLVNAQLMTNTL